MNSTENRHLFSHIDQFRDGNYRVFYAAPFFNLDLKKEISWHKAHLKKLKKHAERPDEFLKEIGHEEMTPEKRKHYQEHVIDSIPFHTKILRENEQRLKGILEVIPSRYYRKLVWISRRYGGTPEYFVYDKIKKDFFFVADSIDETKKHWISLVKDVYKICDVVVLKK